MNNNRTTGNHNGHPSRQRDVSEGDEVDKGTPERIKGGANVPLESEGMTTQNWEGGVAEVGIAKQTLLDTGAWLSYVSLSFVKKKNPWWTCLFFNGSWSWCSIHDNPIGFWGKLN